MKYLQTCLATLASVAVLSACDSSPPDSAEARLESPAVAPARGASSIPEGIVADRSVPDATANTGAVNSSGTSAAGTSAGTVAGGSPAGVSPSSGKDNQSPDPLSEMTKERESTEMPKALDGNNHSSPNVGTDAKPPTQ